MKELWILILAAALVAPASAVLAGQSNPMSQGYNARTPTIAGEARDRRARQPTQGAPRQGRQDQRGGGSQY